MNKKYSIAIHGGAGTIDLATLSQDVIDEVHQGLKDAVVAGETILAQGGSALDAVEAAVVVLENAPRFNAGYGACLTFEGHHELDAAIADGCSGDSGAVANVRYRKNPVKVARAVLSHTDHILLGGEGAERFADELGFDRVTNESLTTDLRREHWETLQEDRDNALQFENAFRFGTVGAVACDRDGNLAAATSTGGITNKRWGRIGDTPLPGAGNYAANDSCAVSCTGKGEYFIKHAVGHDLAARMRYLKQPLKVAVREVLEGSLNYPNGAGGLIAVDNKGKLVVEYNSTGMYRGWKYEEDSTIYTGIEAELTEHSV